MQKLKVVFNGKDVGQLNFDTENDSIKFEYDSKWTEEGFVLSPHIPFHEEVSSGAIGRFLENLFPEGEALEELLESYRIGKKNIFRITQLIGRDATGALVFKADEEDENNTRAFRKISEEEMEQRLNERATKGLIMWDGKARLSVAGVQDKLPVTILSDGQMGLGEGDIASTHILKFQKDDANVPHLVLNEYFCMTLASRVDLLVPEVEFKKFGRHPALLVKRFDREIISDDKVVRNHIIDGCQAQDLRTTYKYEKNHGSGKDVAHIRDGVSLKKLFEFCMQTQNPAESMFRTLKWTLFNLCISNSDAHGKNISYFVKSSGSQLSISPWYDLVNIAIYPDLDHELAMAIGNEFNPEEIFAYQLIEFCEDCKIAPKLLKGELTKIVKKIRNEIPQMQIPSMAGSDNERKFWESMIQDVEKKCQHFDRVIPDLLKIKI